MKSDTLFYTIKKWLGFGKKTSYVDLEKPNETNENTQFAYTDIFGNILNENELVLPILYNEIARYGYVTISPNYDNEKMLASKLTDWHIKRGVIKYADFLDGLDNRSGLIVEESRRRGFFHVHTPIEKVLEQYRHRTA